MNHFPRVAAPQPRKPGLRVDAYRQRRSSALLLVLGMIVLVSALVLAFLASVSSELTSSKIYANGATVRQLADSATQLVMSQVVSATDNTNSTLAWASQPGMIRTYDTSGNPAYFYKLYSAANMITNAGASTFNPANEVPPATWDSANNAGIYIDLNSPVASNGTNYFPIVDPRAYSGATATSVEGFTYSGSVDGVVLPSGSATSQRLPMPVRWLYVLQNGAIATPVSGNNGTVTFDTTNPNNVPSATNPIVGRIAFWTDDETCKVNINTASEGTFWDRPWLHTATEEKYSSAIPSQNEFQRYPGHPAKTCLSSVFGPLGLPTPWPNATWYYGIPSATETSYTNQLAAFYGLAPRVSDGGTEGGNISEDINPTTTTTASNPAFLTNAAKADRLYASSDELLYAPTNSASYTRVANTENGTTMTNDMLEKAKFFITAHSRAPELNLFGKPRMTLWPLQLSTSLRNAKDALIAFCSTINGKAYYFQRQSAYSSFGTACSSQDQVADWTMTDSTGETRNQTLYNYLDTLTQQNIPGFGGNFNSKYPNTRRQILTEMFDMIRSGVNSYSMALTPTYNYTPQLGDSGEGQIVPLAPNSGNANGTRGFGRFATVTSAAIVFYRANVMSYATNSVGQITLPPTPTPATAAPSIAAAFFIQPYTVSPGLPAWSPNVHYAVTGLDQLAISSASTSATPLGFPSLPDNYACGRMEYSGAQNSTAGNTTAFLSFKAFLRYPNQEGVGLAGTDSTKTFGTSTTTSPVKAMYPFFSPITGVVLGASDTTFNFSGSTPNPIQIKIYSDNNGAEGQLLQTINMNFPAVTGLPMPTTAANNYFAAHGLPPDSNYSSRWAAGAGPSTYQTRNFRQVLFDYQNDYVGTDTGNNVVQSTTMDVVRGVQPDPNGPAKGDLRVYQALSTVPTSYFTTCTNYDSGTNPQTYPVVHALRDGGYAGSYGKGDYQYGWDTTTAGTLGTPTAALPIYPWSQMHTWQIAGNLVPTTYLASGTTSGNGLNAGTSQPEYVDGFNPAVPFGLNGAFQSGGAAGDWDNMTGNIEDGPYINKPDEGNSDTTSDLQSAAGDFAGAAGAYSSGLYGSTYYALTGGYFSRGLNRTTGFDYRATGATTLSPNRQVASAVMFGSLPTGIDPTGATAPKPWQTLLFCPNPPAGASHPGFGSPSSGPPYTTPPDHLMLDLFTMPVVEPYAISEPLSTAGKVNMNYQILPFTYITRDTGVRAVLKSTRITAIPTSASTEIGAIPAYKDGKPYSYECRYNINPGTESASDTDGTLYGFNTRFNNGDIFRSASEICGIYLVPQMIPGASTSTFSYPTGVTVPSTYNATAAWWNNFRLTGDNAREFPYGDIYPRLTTKSNTYTVHVRVQTLKKISTTAANQWVEGTDLVAGEYRGSSLIERYVDTSDPTLPDFTQSGSPSVEGYYKMRVVSTKQFAP